MTSLTCRQNQISNALFSSLLALIPLSFHRGVLRTDSNCLSLQERLLLEAPLEQRPNPGAFFIYTNYYLAADHVNLIDDEELGSSKPFPDLVQLASPC